MTTRPFFDDSIALSRPMQQRLQTRIAQHNGDVEPVIMKVRDELAQLDADPTMREETNRPQFQSQRALLVAEIDYLMLVVNRQQEQEPSRSRTFWARFRRPTRQTPATE